jgi:hypothetical protein
MICFFHWPLCSSIAHPETSGKGDIERLWSSYSSCLEVFEMQMLRTLELLRFFPFSTGMSGVVGLFCNFSSFYIAQTPLPESVFGPTSSRKSAWRGWTCLARISAHAIAYGFVRFHKLLHHGRVTDSALSAKSLEAVAPLWVQRV